MIGRDRREALAGDEAMVQRHKLHLRISPAAVTYSSWVR